MADLAEESWQDGGGANADGGADAGEFSGGSYSDEGEAEGDPSREASTELWESNHRSHVEARPASARRSESARIGKDLENFPMGDLQNLVRAS